MRFSVNKYIVPYFYVIFCYLKTKHYICKGRYNDTFNGKHYETLSRFDISH